MSESEYIHKSHNASVLLYHFVCPVKYRRVVFSKAVDMTIKEICFEIEKREVFKKHPEVKAKPWGGKFWTDGYFVNTVSKFGDKGSITKYVRDQWLKQEYTILHSSKPLALFYDTPLFAAG